MPVDTPLLATKLFIPPRRPERVIRPHLVERLDAGLARKLTLVSAPAGFGKTTLVADWLCDTDRPAAWLSLDRNDSSPTLFWRYVIAALQTIAPATGEPILAALQSSEPPAPDSIVASLVNDLAATPAPLVLVLDDYHAIENGAVHSSLDLLLDHAPPHVHLVVITRADPPLSLPRRRGRAELTELRAADLRFTIEEAAAFLNTCMGLDLAAEDVAALESRTEGWPVGLQMAALVMQGQPDKHRLVAAFAGDDRYVGDYLIEEVLQGQPQDVQSFLLQTSILERLCGPLCNAVTGRDDGQAVLETLERTNLFTVPLDNNRTWYRTHRLFADLLRHRLEQASNAQTITALYVRASEWFEQEGLIAEAVSYTLASRDTTTAAELIERHVLDVFYRSEIALVHSWLQSLPQETLRSHPLLAAVYASTTALREPHPQSLDLADQWLRQAEQALASESTTGPEGTATYSTARGFALKFRAYLASFRGDAPETVITLTEQALARLPEDELLFRSALACRMGNAYRQMGDEAAAERAFAQARRVGLLSGDLFNASAAIAQQAEIAHSHGRLHKAVDIARQGLESLHDQTGKERPIPYAAAIYTLLGNVELEWNHLQDAERDLTKGLELARLAETRVQMNTCIALARLRHAQGNTAAAYELLDQAERARPDLASRVALHRVRFWLGEAAQNPRRLAAAADWAEGRQFAASDGRANETSLTLARVLIAQRQAQPDSDHLDLQPLLRFLEQESKTAQAQGWVGREIESLNLYALALQALDEPIEALECLKRALALGKPEEYGRVFVDEGEPMETLLRHAASHGTAPAYVSNLLAMFSPEPQGSTGPSALIEPLSPRELEVLHHIATGASNPEIAKRLFISINTVKKHATHIYGKLQAASRIQAVARARELELIE